MARLDGKRILITGSTSGIGAALARRAVAEGARVLVHGLERDLGERLVEELGEGKAVLQIADFADPESPGRLVAAAVEGLGGLDAVVNNAAWIGASNLEETDAARFDLIMAINVRAPFLLIRAALPHLAKSNGCVLNIGSVNAHCGEPELVPYSVSKGALMTLTRNLGDSLHVRHGVRVNQINPGWILTENERARKISEGMPEDWPETVERTTCPAGRLIRPEEIAEAAVYWLSDAAGPVSGQVVDIAQVPFIGRNPPKL